MLEHLHSMNSIKHLAGKVHLGTRRAEENKRSGGSREEYQVDRGRNQDVEDEMKWLRESNREISFEATKCKMRNLFI